MRILNPQHRTARRRRHQRKNGSRSSTALARSHSRKVLPIRILGVTRSRNYPLADLPARGTLTYTPPALSRTVTPVTCFIRIMQERTNRSWVVSVSAKGSLRVGSPPSFDASTATTGYTAVSPLPPPHCDPLTHPPPFPLTCGTRLFSLRCNIETT